jgi:hypothetical protein
MIEPGAACSLVETLGIEAVMSSARPKARAGPCPCASHLASSTIRPHGLPPVMISPRRSAAPFG